MHKRHQPGAPCNSVSGSRDAFICSTLCRATAQMPWRNSIVSLHGKCTSRGLPCVTNTSFSCHMALTRAPNPAPDFEHVTLNDDSSSSTKKLQSQIQLLPSAASGSAMMPRRQASIPDIAQAVFNRTLYFLRAFWRVHPVKGDNPKVATQLSAFHSNRIVRRSGRILASCGYMRHMSSQSLHTLLSFYIYPAALVFLLRQRGALLRSDIRATRGPAPAACCSSAVYPEHY